MRSDVCLILEGTYPYVAGGVSTWVAQLLANIPHLRFSILHIGATRNAPRSLRYEIPPNVVEIREVFVHDYPAPSGRHAPRSVVAPAAWEAVEAFQEAVLQGEAPDVDAAARAVAPVETGRDFIDTFAASREAWEATIRQYERYAPSGFSLQDFFWTWRFVNIPPLHLLRTPLPEARVYHTACTGYAGLLATKARSQRSGAFILTEHGLYTRERRIEIFNAEWIRESDRSGFLDMQRSSGFAKEWWTCLFQSMSRAAYRSADRITALFEDNRRDQVLEGAPRERVSVIPNGIEVEPFLRIAPPERSAGGPLRIGFVGRIAPIKDVKTLLKALAVLRGRGIPFEASLLGPLDEEEQYANDCQQLAGSLGIDDSTRFLGRVEVAEHLPNLDVVVLTSISEGQPFAVLEANGAGRAVVATDVGACREILHGRTPEDRALGASGILTAVASPEATAEALERLALAPDLVRRMGETGRQRVRRFYDIRTVMQSYQELYEHYLYAGAPGRAGETALPA